MTSLWHHQFISIIAVILYGFVAILCNINDIKSCTSLLQRELPLATSIRLPGHLLENNQLSQEDATSCCPQSSTLHNLPITTKLLNVAYNFGFCTIPTVLHRPQALTIFLYFTLHTITTEVTGVRVGACVWMCVLCVHVCACVCMYMHCVSCVWSFVSYMPISMYWICTQLQYTTPIGIVWITYLTIKQLSVFIADCLHHIARYGSLCGINWSVILDDPQTCVVKYFTLWQQCSKDTNYCSHTATSNSMMW